MHLEMSVKVGSILTDIDYGEAFDALEKIYGIAMIGDLATDNAHRKEKHTKLLKEKGLTA
jgi:hypothetical protein